MKNKKILDTMIKAAKTLTEFSKAVKVLGQDSRRFQRVETARRLHAIGHKIRERIISL